MVGKQRLLNIFDLIRSVVKEKAEGAFLEAGVWRGGGSIFAASLFQALQESNRAVILCDSFHGLPPGNEKFHKKDVGWDHKPYLEVSDQIVARNFHKYGVLTDHVYFVKGFFNDSLTHLAPVLRPNSISILRMDGDMYQSTVDILYHLYDKLSVGGYVIVDDWTGFSAKIAVEDFFACHKIAPEVIPIDEVSVYFKKTEKIEVQRWRYEKNSFKPTDVQ